KQRLELPRAGAMEQRDVIRPKSPAQRRELFDIAMRGERHDAKAIGMAGDDVQRRVADRARGPEQRERAHFHAGSRERKARIATGALIAAGACAQIAMLASWSIMGFCRASAERRGPREATPQATHRHSRARRTDRA